MKKHQQQNLILKNKFSLMFIKSFFSYAKKNTENFSVE